MWKWEVCNQGNNDVPGEYPSAQISRHHPKPSCTLTVTCLLPIICETRSHQPGSYFGEDLQEKGAAEYYTMQVCKDVTAAVCQAHQNHDVSANESSWSEHSCLGAM